MRNRKVSTWLLGIIIVILIAVFIYYLPPVHDRLAWRVDEMVLRVKYRLNPPQEVVFTPQEQVEANPSSTTPPSPTSSPTHTPDPTEAGPTQTPQPSPTPTITPAPLPAQASLQGVRYDDQHGRFNYCAPANLSMALSYWGWDGDKDTLGPVVKPDPKDKNVMPYEMADYVLNNTDLGVVVRVGGDLDTIKRFVSAGYPVLVEKGTYLRDLTGVVSWMGHYQVVTGYDDGKQEFITQDTYVGPDHTVPYDEMIRNWRAFNYTYLIIYPPEEQAQVMALLGTDADETTNYQHAAQLASDEIFALEDIDQYFAWFNRGTNLMYLQDYAGAADAYNNAFAIYAGLPTDDRPWRMLWYQTGPYFAYFYSQDYWNVVNLADTTLNAMQSDQNLEESYYWRAMAKAALGDTAGAIADYRTSLKYHPGFAPALYQLELLGATP
ncbi:MAG: C39 family peptidase [Chloroflexota bacterium]|nr:C39 family peptidase [Chloroflexota bacterium]